MTKAAVLAFPSTESLQVLRNGTPVSLTPKVQAVIEMLLDEREAVEMIPAHTSTHTWQCLQRVCPASPKGRHAWGLVNAETPGNTAVCPTC